MSQKYSIAFFISPHGYGHAARSCAVIQQLAKLLPDHEFHIFTLAPEWFFHDSLKGVRFSYHPLQTDVGFIQLSPLHIDFDASLKKLAEFIPPDQHQLHELSSKLLGLNCRAVICDISPLGVLAGRQAGLPVFLLENFTWDWIYEFYLDTHPGFSPYVDFFRQTYQEIDFHIQAEPASAPTEKSYTCAPISRTPRCSKDDVRAALNIPQEARVILISTGGIAARHHFAEKLIKLGDCFFIIPNNTKHPHHYKNIIELPHHSQFYHPDLVNAADALICKLGYSTIAEVYQAGLPALYISRADFRESYPMGAFVNEHLPSIEITSEDFEQQNWLERISDLMKLKPLSGSRPNGDIQAAAFIAEKIT